MRKGKPQSGFPETSYALIDNCLLMGALVHSSASAFYTHRYRQTNAHTYMDGEESEDYGDYVTRCICGFTHDDGYMIACDGCRSVCACPSLCVSVHMVPLLVVFSPLYSVYTCTSYIQNYSSLSPVYIVTKVMFGLMLYL